MVCKYDCNQNILSVAILTRFQSFLKYFTLTFFCPVQAGSILYIDSESICIAFYFIRIIKGNSQETDILSYIVGFISVITLSL